MLGRRGAFGLRLLQHRFDEPARRSWSGLWFNPLLPPKTSRQDVDGCDGDAEGTRRRLADFADVINTAGGTGGNFPSTVQLDVRCQVIGEIDGFAISLMIFQNELIRGGIYLAEVIDTRIDRWSRSRLDKIRHDHQNEESQAKNKTSFCQKGV